MVTALYAMRSIAGADLDVWDVNVDQAYHETISEEETALSDRLVPQRVQQEIDDAIIDAAFARYDPVALGGAVAGVLGLALFLATITLLLRGADPVGPTLSLLGNYLFGYQVSWGGLLIRLIEVTVGGFLFGSLVGRTINGIIGVHERRFLVEAEFAQSISGVDR